MEEVFWIKSPNGDPTQLAIVMRPRGEDWLENDLTRMKRSGVETLISLLEPKEAEWLGLDEEGPQTEKTGMQFLSFPIPDVHVPPDINAFRAFVTGLAERLRAGERIGLHCRGSIGRGPLTAACTLIHLGWTPSAALAAIEKARGCSIPDTDEQQEWIMNYKAKA